MGRWVGWWVGRRWVSGWVGGEFQNFSIKKVNLCLNHHEIGFGILGVAASQILTCHPRLDLFELLVEFGRVACQMQRITGAFKAWAP